MRLNYLAYQFRNKKDKSLCWHDLSPALKAFCLIPDPVFRNGFKHDEDRVFLLHQTENLFLFIQTKNTNVIEQIDTHRHELKDIEKLLDENDALGIAAYVYIKENFIAYCSPSLAPRFPVFFRFVNEILDRLNIKDCEVVSQPILMQSSLADVRKAAHIGRSTVTMEVSRNVLQDLAGVFGGEMDDYSDLDIIEITFRPKKGKSAKAAVSRALDRDEVQKANVRGKLDYEDRVMDLYIDSSGPVTDSIALSDKKSAYDKIIAKISSNAVLQEKLTGLADNENITPLNDRRISSLANVTAWADHLPNIQLERQKVAKPPARNQ